ncbi:hypothetical protein BJ138DRAFT_645794 [Hygrophoropsis aurantiaca]|uniref:Uncharacterized protein n=1 Tax=Hygrophoropsis aurantiaca TaxID=72124 RepID=A0ACB8AKK0_9AGAM|nr:hypothetical protein BJ138DRAFT_645794 [Hygrophoropsis aurantiaca]
MTDFAPSSPNGSWPVDPTDTQELVYAIRDVKLITYATVAGTAVLFYDYFLTFNLEVRHIWPARWSTLKFLYIHTRYAPFLDTVFMMYHFYPEMDEHKCRVVIWIIGWLYTTGMATSELILMLRTWAVWRRSRNIACILGLVYALACAPAYYSTIRFVESIVYAPFSPPNAPQCIMLSSNRLTLVHWGILMTTEALVLGLTLIQTAKSYRQDVRMGLARLIVKDGITYYICLCTLSLLNPRLDLLMATPIRNVHSVLTARMVLRMREHNRVAIGGGTTAVAGALAGQQSLVFATIPQPARETYYEGEEGVELGVGSWWVNGPRKNLTPVDEDSQSHCQTATEGRDAHE